MNRMLLLQVTGEYLKKSLPNSLDSSVWVQMMRCTTWRRALNSSRSLARMRNRLQKCKLMNENENENTVKNE